MNTFKSKQYLQRAAQMVFHRRIALARRNSFSTARKNRAACACAVSFAKLSLNLLGSAILAGAFPVCIFAQTATVTVQVTGQEQLSAASSVWDVGTVGLLVNGSPVNINYGQYSTTTSVASALAAKISESCSSSVAAHAAGNSITLFSRAGTPMQINVTGQTVQNPIFANPSFSISQPSGSQSTNTVLSTDHSTYLFGESISGAGTVTTSDGTTPVGSLRCIINGGFNHLFPLSTTGAASISVSAAQVGVSQQLSCTFVSSVQGYLDSTASVQVNIKDPTITVLSESQNPINLATASQPVILNALVSQLTETGVVPLSGTVDFYDGTVLLASLPVSADGTAAWSYDTSPDQLTPGLHSLHAKYSGDSLNSWSKSSDLTENVGTVTVTSVSETSVSPGAEIVISGNFSSGQGTVTVGSAIAPILLWTQNYIIATIPAQSTSNEQLTVISQGIESNSIPLTITDSSNQ